MKFSKVFFVLFALLVTLPYFLSAVETKYEMELWNRMTYIDDDSKTDPTTSFSVERGYFSIKPKLSENISGRFTLDLFSSDNDSNGAGLKMKYAYLDFKNLFHLPKSQLSIGLTKNYFATVYSWKYETIEKDPSDLWKFASSTDYGIVFSSSVPVAKLSYNFGIYNGEGYKKSGEKVNSEYAYLANLRIKPIEKLELGGSLSLNSKHDPNDELGEDNIEHQSITSFAGIGKFKSNGVTLLGQYLGKRVELDNVDDSQDVSSQAISVLGMYDLTTIANINLELVGRYDRYDPNTDNESKDDKTSLILFGTNYYLQKNIQIQANYSITSHEDDTKEDISVLMLQLRWSFANLLSN